MFWPLTRPTRASGNIDFFGKVNGPWRAKPPRQEVPSPTVRPTSSGRSTAAIPRVRTVYSAFGYRPRIRHAANPQPAKAKAVWKIGAYPIIG